MNVKEENGGWNIFYNNDYGIRIDDASNNFIENNVIYDNDYSYGITGNSEYNTFRSNRESNSSTASIGYGSWSYPQTNNNSYYNNFFNSTTIN